MDHIDERTLELYVLEDAEAAEKRAEIEAHLAVCRGCSDLVGRMQAFHRELKEELSKSESLEPVNEKALIRSRSGISPYCDPFGAPIPYRSSTPMEKFRYVIRRHPVMAGASSFAAVGVLAFLLNSGLGNFWHDKNPANYTYNIKTQAIEVFNKSQELLWDLKIPTIERGQVMETEKNVHCTIVADLDNSGENRVLTTLTPLDADDRHGGRLRVFDKEKVKTADIAFERPVHYLDRSYSPYFQPGGLLVLGMQGTNEKNIFVIAENIGRSPSVLHRLDRDGKAIGEYWHFGTIQCIYRIESGALEGDLMIGGINDAQDTVLGGYPFVAVLDPARIVGERKSRACPGYEMPESNAELFYIRLPLSDIDLIGRTFGMVTAIWEEDGTTFRMQTTSGIRQPQGLKVFHFEYFIDNQMHVLRVKSENGTDALHAELAQEGRVRGRIDEAYLNELRNGVRYWNGKEWQKERTTVKR